MIELDGILITGVVSVGQSDDEHAFIECRLHDGSLCAVGFAPDMAAPICSAFLAAAGLLAPKDTHSVAAIIKAVRATKASITSLRFGTHRPNLVLTVSTLAGPKLCFELPWEAGESLAQTLASALLRSAMLRGSTH